LVSILPYDRAGRFEPNTYAAALIDKGALGGNAPDDTFGVNIGAILLPPLDARGS
jgi:hypothetical protein